MVRLKRVKPQVALLTAFIKDKLHITTSLMSAIELPNGEVVEAPWALEGILLDFDEMFLLLGQQDSDALELIALDKIVAMKQVSDADEVMRDPQKPHTGDMN